VYPNHNVTLPRCDAGTAVSQRAIETPSVILSILFISSCVSKRGCATPGGSFCSSPWSAENIHPILGQYAVGDDPVGTGDAGELVLLLTVLVAVWNGQIRHTRQEEAR